MGTPAKNFTGDNNFHLLISFEYNPLEQVLVYSYQSRENGYFCSRLAFCNRLLRV